MAKRTKSRPTAASQVPHRVVRLNITNREGLYDENPWRELRRVLGLNQSQLGRGIGRSRQLWSFYETGTWSPRLDVLKSLAELTESELIIEFRPKVKLGGHAWEGSDEQI